MKISHRVKIEETLKDFNQLMLRYREVHGNEMLMDMFLSRNRNPIFDLSNIKMFKTGLQSNGSLSETNKKLKTEDHYIQRKKGMKHIFDYMMARPNIGYDEFVGLLIKYISTVTLTKEEHRRVTALAKKNKDKYNFELYSLCGIVVEGLNDIIPGELL